MTLSEVESILENTKHNAFPVVISRESHFLVGCVLRRDLLLAIGRADSFVLLLWYLNVKGFSIFRKCATKARRYQ